MNISHISSEGAARSAAIPPLAPVGGRDRRSDERELLVAARSGRERERAEFVNAYLPNIAAVARDYRDVRAVNREELMQAGVLGLLRALERYDPERENLFWTYARWWVRQAMQELVSSVNNVVVLSDRALRQLARVNAARHSRVQSSRCEPSSSEVAAVVGLPSAQVAMLMRASRPARGLDEPVDGDQDGRSLAETLGDPASEDAFEHARLRLAARALPAALSTLTGRELSIIRGRYGLGGRRYSLSELAEEWQVSRERVRQIERVAMGKLRDSCDAPRAEVS